MNCFFTNEHCHDTIMQTVLFAKTSSVPWRLVFCRVMLGTSYTYLLHFANVVIDKNSSACGRHLPDVTPQPSACLPAAEITPSELIGSHLEFVASSYQCPKCCSLEDAMGSLCLLEKF